jgi:hypothetical protein
MSFVADIPCGLPGVTCSSAVGYITVAMAFIVFVGSIYLLLAAAFGPRMAYFVLAVGFFGWMILFSAIWAFGTGAPESTNLGPRGTEPHWQPVGVGIEVASPRYPVVERYPGPPWVSLGSGKLGPDGDSSVQSVTTAIQEFMAERANEQNGAGAGSEGALESTDFSVEDVEFTTHGGVSLATARAFFNGGGPKVTVFAYHDSGSVPMYSWMFFGGSILGFVVHLPFLDRAERRRKAVLTGGKRPPWYGPA